MNEPIKQLQQLSQSKYQVLELVGHGQFGRVYRAIHQPSGKVFALKELDKKRFPTHKFLREMVFLTSLQHPNVVTFQGLEHTPTGRYIVMDYCEGGDLRSLMKSKGQLNLSQSLRLVADVLAGLEHIHNRKIIHRDIKPENILLSHKDGGLIARISDFGLSRLCNELCADKQADCNGSPAYMAPERFYGQYSHASDLYAVGVMLFELVTGDRPFSGLPQELMSAHLNQTVKVPDSVPFLLRSTITTALQKLPLRRFRSTSEMLKSVQLAMEVVNLAESNESQPQNIDELGALFH